MKNNIILIGMPGSGKTTVGTELAEKIGFGYIDSDSVIVAREGMRLDELIATGGSVIYRAQAMEKLKALGKVVYLRLSYETVAGRLGDLKKRGVAIKEGYTLKDLYSERTPLYEKYADIVVDLDGKTVAESVDALAEAVR